MLRKPLHHLSVTASVGSLMLIVLLLATACSPTTQTSSVSHATPTPSVTVPVPTATPTVVYRADWSQGLAGWQATPGWSIQNGALQSDAGRQRAFTVPYEPTTPDYAIEYALQIVEPHDGGECDFAAHPQPGHNGWVVGLYNLLSPTTFQGGLAVQFGILLDPAGEPPSSNYSPLIDFVPRTFVRNYRVEVRGAHAIVLVDGHQYSPGAQSFVTPTLSRGPFTFNCSLAVVRITSITVSSL